jgi:hypothetical protein
MAKRKIFDELMEGIAVMQGQRDGEIALDSYKVEPLGMPRVNARTIR